MAHWYCVKTTPRAEPTAQFCIGQLGYPVFCPQILVEVKQRIRAPWKNLHRLVPMFSTYVFAQFDLNEAYLRWPLILQQRGVARILGPTDRPTALPDGVVDWLQDVSRIAMRTPQAVSLAIPTGSLVRITDGPLADLSGICAWSNEKRVLLLMEWLGGERRLEVPRTLVEVI